MSPTFALILILATLVGITMGTLGGGGSILTVPLLVYIAGLDAKEAVASSLLVVCVTSAVSVIAHARAGRVQVGTALSFGVAGMAGAFTGGRLATWVPGKILLISFALVMTLSALGMLLRRSSPGEPRPPLPRWATPVLGVAVGVVTGFVGAGGGFLIVPALVLIGGLSMPTAVGTSLLIIALQSAAGLAGHLSGTPLPWALSLTVTACAVIGSLLGGRFTARIDPDHLQRGFGALVLGMGLLVLGEQLSDARVRVGLAALAVTTLTVTLWRARRPREVAPEPPR